MNKINPTKIIVSGCFGKLGGAVCRLAAQNPEAPKALVVAGIDIVPPSGGLEYPTYTDINNCDIQADVVVAAPPPTAVVDIMSTLDYCVQRRIPLVLCTTGLSDDIHKKMKEAARDIAVFQSGNMSLGINLLVNMIGKASKLLYDAGFDIEIIEKHHNQKIDAPSGTAYMLAEAANQALGGKLDFVCDRSQTQEKRKHNEIGLHALRGGSIVGEHNIVFAGQDEEVEFTHMCNSRDVFAIGTVKAALYIKDKPAGLYGMQDMIDEI